LASKLLAEATRCARDEDPRIVCCRHFVHLQAFGEGAVAVCDYNMN
jgi:hypothetical protein